MTCGQILIAVVSCFLLHFRLYDDRYPNFGMDDDVKDLNPFVDDTRETLSLPRFHILPFLVSLVIFFLFVF